jgi:hypothetical protein
MSPPEEVTRRPRRIVQIEANMTRTDGALERDLYALDDQGDVWSFHFETTTTGRWIRLQPLPDDEAT